MLDRRSAAALLLLLSACKQDEKVPTVTWELRLDVPPSVVAGEETEYSLIAVGSDGTERELDSWTITSDVEPELDWNELRIRPVRATDQNLVVEGLLDDSDGPLAASAEIAVKPGPAANISLELDAHEGSYEVGDEIFTEVTIRDAFNNETRDPWELSAEGGDVLLEGSSVTFQSDGVYTIRATVTGTDIHDDEGPFTVDSTGPVFTMGFPEHVDVQKNTLAHIKGNVTDTVSGVLFATLDGEDLPFDESGYFDLYDNLDFGINVKTLQAVDNDGNETELVNTVLCGDQLSAAEVVPEGVLVHLGDGEGGLIEITDGLDAVIEDIDITSSLPIEIVSTKYDVAIVDVDYRFDGVEIVPADDVLEVNTSLSNIEVDIEGQVKTLWWIDATGSVDVDEVTVTVELEPRVTSSGGLAVDVADTRVSVSGLELDFEASLFSAIESVGLDKVLEEYVTSLLEDQIASAVESAVSTQVEAALGSLTLDYSVTVMESIFQLTGEFSRVDVDEGGITLALDVSVVPETDDADPWLDGSLYAAYEAPMLTDLGGVAAGVNVDLLNRILYLAWAEGALDQALTSEQVGLSSDALALVFPEATSVTFATEAMLPPVLLPGDLMTPLEAQIGALRIVTVDQNNDMLLDITVGALMDVDVDASGLTLTPSMEMVGDPWIEISYVAEQSTGIVNYDAMILLLLPQVVDNMAAALQAVTLPSVSGSTLSIDRISLYGEDGGYLTAVGTMDIATE